MASNSDNDNKPRTNIIEYLPDVYNSDVNQSVFEQSFNRFLTKDDTTFVSGLIGEPSQLQNSRQLPEPTPQLQAFQLQPLAYTRAGNTETVLTFKSFEKQLEFLGVDKDRMNKWGKAQEFNWIPPINLDMFVNYQDYYWVSSNNIQPNYLTIENPCLKYQARTNVYQQLLNTYGSTFPIVEIDIVNNCIVLDGRLDALFRPNAQIFIKSSTLTPNINIDNKYYTILSVEYFEPEFCSEEENLLENKTKLCVEQDFVLKSSTQPITTPQTIIGTWWFDTTNEKLMSWNGTMWVETNPVITSVVSLSEILDIFIKETNCICYGDYGWDLSLWDNNTSDFQTYLQPYSHPTEASWISQNGPPTISALWYDTNQDALFQYNGTTWVLIFYNFSQRVLDMSLNDVLWDLTVSCFDQLITPSQWSTENRWIHKSQLSTTQNVKRAQVPILEYDSRVELNSWTKRTYQWKYRSEIGQDFQSVNSQPTLLELTPVIDYIAVETPPASGNWFIYLYNNTSSVQKDIDWSEIFVPGFVFRIRDDGILNKTYTVEYSLVREPLPTDPAGVQGRHLITIVKISENIFTAPLVGGGINKVRIEPTNTSVGDLWRGYHAHWVLDVNNFKDHPTDTQQENPILKRALSSTQAPFSYTGTTNVGPITVGQYFQTTTVNVPTTNIKLDVSLQYTQTSALLIVGVVSGVNGTFTVLGDYTSVFSTETPFIVRNNTGGANGIYSVQSSTLSFGNTIITVNGTIPLTATPDGNIVGGTSSFALANQESLAVYVNGIRQYGNYQEITNVGIPIYTAVGTTTYNTQTFEFVSGIVFDQPLQQFDVVQIQIAPHAYNDLGKSFVPIRTIENESDFNASLIAGTQPVYKSTIEYFKTEQVKKSFNQYPLFNVYDVCTNEVIGAKRLFGFLESETAPVNPHIQRRVVAENQTSNFVFEQTLVERDDGKTYAFRLNDERVPNLTFWYNEKTNQLKYRNNNVWEMSFVYFDTNDFIRVSKPYVGEIPPPYLVNNEYSIWYDTKNRIVKQALSNVWQEIAWPEYDNPLNSPTPQGLLIEKADPTLTTIWRSVNQYTYNSSGPWYQWSEGSYTPQWVDKNRQPLTIGDPNGDWEIPKQWRFNIEHKNKQQISYADLITHFQTIINAQQTTNVNILPQQEWKYWVGGTIKEYNDSYDTLISAINEQKTTPLSVIEFAQNQYDNGLLTIKQLYLNSFISLMTRTTNDDIYNQQGVINQNILNQYESNDFYGFVYGDTSAFNQLTETGVRNWISTPPIFGLSEKFKPHIIIDKGLNIYEVYCHDGHREQINLSLTERDAIIRLLINTPDSREPDTTYGVINSSAPPNTFASFQSYFQTRTGVYWYKNVERILYRFEAIISATPPLFTDSNGNELPDGIVYYNSFLNQMYEKQGLTWVAVGPANDVSLGWVEKDIRKILCELIYSIEEKLYQVSPDYKNLVFDYSSLTPDVGEQAVYDEKQKQQFYSFVENNKIVFPFENLQYNAQDAFTWNYINSTITTPPTTFVSPLIAASWQELYTRWYGTPYPHLEPWKLQGYHDKPLWWDDEYLDLTGNRRWIYNHATLTGMWQNIRVGIVPAGRTYPDGSLSTGNPVADNQVLPTYIYFSVNISDDCLTSSGATTPCGSTSAVYSPDDLLPPYFALTTLGPNATPTYVRSLFTSFSGEIVAPGSNFVYGEGGPTEWLWSVSSEYVYDKMIVAFKMQPVRFMHYAFGLNFTRVNNLQIEQQLCQVYSHEDALFHGDVFQNALFTARGLNQWYVNNNRFSGYDTNGDFRNYWVNWDPKLSYQFSGIVDTTSLDINNRFYDIDQQDYNVVLSNMGAIDDVWLDAFQVTILKTPPKIVQYNNQTQWRMSLDVLSLVSKPIFYYDVKQYPFIVDPITNTASAFAFRITGALSNAKLIEVGGDQVNHFVPQVEITISGSTANDGVYSVSSSVYDPSSDKTRITLNELLPSSIADGVVDINDVELPWETGQVVFITSSQILPAPLTTSREFYIIKVGAKGFRLADSIANANANIAIDIVNQGNGEQYVGEVDSSFFVFGGVGPSRELWFHYALDKTKIRTFSPPSTIAGFQRLINIIDGYKAYQEDKNVRYNLVEVYETDPDTQRTVSWQLEIERFIDWAYQTRGINSRVEDRFNFSVQSIPGTQGYKQNGFQVLKSLTDITGLQSITYSFLLSVDGSPFTSVAIDGSLSQTYQQLITEINAQLTLLAIPAIASFETFNNGAVRITSNSTGPFSSVNIVDVDLFGSLFDSTPLQNSVNGSGSLFAFSDQVPAWVAGTAVKVGTTGSLPTGLSADVTYYVHNSTIPGLFELSTTKTKTPSSAVVVSSAGGGLQFISQFTTRTQFPSFEINPMRNNVWITTPQGVLANIISGPYEDIRIKQSIFDQYGRILTPDKLLVYREDKRSRISIRPEIPNDLKPSIAGIDDPYNYIHMGGGHFFITGYQHVLIFNDYTSGNFLVFDQFKGLQAQRFSISYYEKNDFSLRPTLGGYYLLGNQYERNIEGQITDMRNYYSVYNTNDFSPVVDYARNLIGFNKSLPYLDLLNINKKSQFEFYRGAIQSKGSTNSITAFINNKRFISANVDEAWAWKIAEYGDAREKVYPELKLFAADGTLEDVRFEFLTNNEASQSQFVEQAKSQRFEVISFRDDTRWYEYPDQKRTLNGSVLFLDAKVVSRMTIFVKNVPPLEEQANRIDYWYDTSTLTLRKFDSTISGPYLTKWIPVDGIVRASDMYYVKLGQPCDTVRVIRKTLSGFPGYQEVLFNVPLFDAKATGLNPLINYTTSITFNNLQTINISVLGSQVQTFGELIDFLNSKITPYGRAQMYNDTIRITNAFKGSSSDVSISILDLLFNSLDDYLSVQPSQPGIDSSNDINEYTAESLIVDGGGTDGFIRINSQTLAFDFTAFYDILEIYCLRPNFASNNPGKLLDKISNVVISEVPYWHPAYNKHFYLTEHNINVFKDSDPAKYTNTLIFDDVSLNPWNEVEVGTIWANSSYLDYLPYFDDKIYTDVNDRLFNWGIFSDIGNTKVYQWIQSTVPPQQYTGIALVQEADTSISSELKLNGTPKTTIFKRMREPLVGDVVFLNPVQQTQGRGYQDVQFAIPVNGTTDTGIINDNTPGYQEVEWRTTSGTPFVINAATGIVWNSQSTPPYTAIIRVDGIDYNVSIGSVPNFGGLVSAINQDLDTIAVASIVAGRLRITSLSSSENSSVQILDINLFNSLEVGVATYAYQDVFVGNNKTSASSTGLVGPTTYFHPIDVNGNYFDISVLGSSAPIYGMLIEEINADITGATASLVNGNIRIRSNVLGSAGSVTIGESLTVLETNPNGGSNAITSGGGSPWINPNSSLALDNISTTCTRSGSGGSKNSITYPPAPQQTLTIRGFNFNIPVSATILGIEAQVRKFYNTSGSVTNPIVNDFIVQLRKDVLGPVGNNLASGAWPLSFSTTTYGSPSNLWGTTWTPADLNNSNFGIDITASLGLTVPAASTGSVSANIDYVTIKVYYTTTGGTLFTTALSGFVAVGLPVPGQDAYFATLIPPVNGTNGTPLTMTVVVDGVPVPITIDGDASQTFTELIANINSAANGTFSVELTPSGNLRFISSSVGTNSTIALIDNNLISSIVGVPSGLLTPVTFLLSVPGDYGWIEVPYNSKDPFEENDLTLFTSTDVLPTNIQQSVKYSVTNLQNLPVVAPTIQRFRITSNETLTNVNLIDAGSGILSVVPAFKLKNWLRKPLVKQSFNPNVDFATLTPSTIQLNSSFDKNDLVDVMVNGKIKLFKLLVDSSNQITLPSYTFNRSDFVTVVRQEPALTTEQINFDPDTEDDGTIHEQFKEDYEYTTITIADVNNNNRLTELYYYWVENTTYKNPNDPLSMPPIEIARTLRSIPISYLVVQKPQDDPSITETYGYGAIYGIVYSSPYLYNNFNVIPVFYRQAVLRNAASYIRTDDRYTLRFTRDLTLRDSLENGPSSVNLKNTHTEWKLIRQEQPFNIDRVLWDRLTESLIGFKIDDPTIRVPSLERELYDAVHGTDTQYGLGDDQTFVNGQLAKKTILNYLQRPDINFAPVDINSFFAQYSFDTPANIIAAMNAIYNTFGYKHVNAIWFEVLLDAFSTKSKYKELFKTSWIALTGVRILEVSGLFEE